MAKASQAQRDVSGWVGWISFAAFMLMLSASFQIVAGLVALFKHEIYLVAPRNLVVFDYTAWGWAHLLLGVVLMVSAVSMLNGRWWGRFVGVVVASLSALANFAFVGAYPLWSILIIFMDVLIIYALLVHGREARL